MEADLRTTEFIHNAVDSDPRFSQWKTRGNDFEFPSTNDWETEIELEKLDRLMITAPNVHDPKLDQILEPWIYVYQKWGKSVRIYPSRTKVKIESNSTRTNWFRGHKNTWRLHRLSGPARTAVVEFSPGTFTLKESWWVNGKNVQPFPGLNEDNWKDYLQYPHSAIIVLPELTDAGRLTVSDEVIESLRLTIDL